jgi:aldehyde:ferredoxin oxidoreductase
VASFVAANRVAAEYVLACALAHEIGHDTLPDRFFDSPLPNDALAHLSRERLDALVAEYHRQRGW